MLLKDILARELKAWPETPVDILGQDEDGSLILGLGIRTKEIYTKASNWRDGVTRAEWQAAVEALKAEQAAELKWPDGAEFMGTTKEGDPKVFYRYVAGGYEYRYEQEAYWSKTMGKPRYRPLIPRPTDRAVEWDGVGLPPVGIRIEARNKHAKPDWARPSWYETEIAAHGKELVIFAKEATGHETTGKLEDYEFRPIRTQEQIDAEEREKAIEEMILLDEKGSLSRTHFCGLLYDANYRKKTK